MNSAFELDLDNAVPSLLMRGPDKFVSRHLNELLAERKRFGSLAMRGDRTADETQFHIKKAITQFCQLVMQTRPDLARWVNGNIATMRSQMIKQASSFGVTAMPMRFAGSGSLAGNSTLVLQGLDSVRSPAFERGLRQQEMQLPGIRMGVHAISSKASPRVQVVSKM